MTNPDALTNTKHLFKNLMPLEGLQIDAMPRWFPMGWGLVVMCLLDFLFGTSTTAHWVQFLISGGILLYGRHLWVAGLGELFYRGHLGLHTFTSMAVVLAFYYSFITLLLASLNLLSPGHFNGHGGDQIFPQLYFVTAAAIVLGMTLADDLVKRSYSRIRLLGRKNVLQVEDSVDGNSDILEDSFEDSESCSIKNSSSLLWARRLDMSLIVILSVFLGISSLGLLQVPSEVSMTFVAVLIGFLCLGLPGVIHLFHRIAMQIGINRVKSMGCRIYGDSLLDSLASINLMVFKKFKTLTTGCPQVTDIIPVKVGISPEEILYLSSTLVYRTDHPIRDSILLRSSDSCRTIPQIKEYQYIAGRGVQALFQGQQVILGNSRYLSEQGISCEEVNKRVEDLASGGKTVILLARGGDVVGIIALSDESRSEGQEAMEAFRKMGVRSALLSGDHAGTVKYLSQHLGVDEVHGELTREEITSCLAEFRNRGDRVAMVVNDDFTAPGLAQPEVVIAFGVNRQVPPKGNEIHLDGEDLRNVAQVVRIARKMKSQFRIQVCAFLTYFAVSLSLITLPVAFGFIAQGSLLAGPYRAYWLSLFGLGATLLPAMLIWLACKKLKGPAPGGP